MGTSAFITCRTWSILRRISVGTRTHACPLGDGTRDDERMGNAEVSFAIKLIKTVIKSGGFVSLENPKSSLMWWHPSIISLLRNYGPSGKYAADAPLVLVSFDQCQYGLRSPAGSSPSEVWRKPTTLLTNLPGAHSLACSCCSNHVHTPIFGHVKVFGKSILRSKLAGRYPPRLCAALARLGANASQAA